MTLYEYIKANENVLPFWINNNIDYISQNPEYALRKYYRQFAHGLRDYPKKEVKKVLGSLYGRLYVKPIVFGGLGKFVNIDHGVFIGWITEAMRE